MLAPLRRHVRVVRVGFARARPRRLVARSGNVGRIRRGRRRRALRRDGGSRFGVDRKRRGTPREHRPELVGRDAVAVSGDADVDALGGVVRVRPVPLAHRQSHRAPRRARHLSKVPTLRVAGRVSTVVGRVVEHAVDVGVPVELLELEREVVPVGRRGGGHVVALPSGGLEAVALRFVRADGLRGEADHRNLAQPAGPPGRARGGAWILARTRGVGVQGTVTRARRRWGCGAREERRSRVSSAHGMLQRDLVDYVGARGVCWVRDGRAPSDRTDWTPMTRANAMANNPGRFMTTERRSRNALPVSL